MVAGEESPKIRKLDSARTLTDLLSTNDIILLQEQFQSVLKFSVFFLEINGEYVLKNSQICECNNEKYNKIIKENLSNSQKIFDCEECGYSNIIIPLTINNIKIGYALITKINIKKIKNKNLPYFSPDKLKVSLNFFNSLLGIIIKKSYAEFIAIKELKFGFDLLKVNEDHVPSDNSKGKPQVEIKRQEMETELSEQIEISKYLNQIISSGNHSKNLHHFLVNLLEFSLLFWYMDGGAVFLLDPNKKTASLIYQKIKSNNTIPKIKSINISTQPIKSLYFDKKPILYADLKKFKLNFFKSTGFKTTVCIPFILGNKTIGSLHLGRRSQGEIRNINDSSLIHIGQEIGNCIDKKKIEDQLYESEEKFRNFIENANDIIISVNETFEIVFHNKKAEQVLGYKPLKNKNITEIIRKDQVKKYAEVLEKVKSGKSFSNIKMIFIAKNKKEIIVSGSINGYFKNKEFIATREILRNITKESQTQKRLKEQMEILERFKNVTVTKVLDIQKIEEENKILKKRLKNVI